MAVGPVLAPDAPPPYAAAATYPASAADFAALVPVPLPDTYPLLPPPSSPTQAVGTQDADAGRRPSDYFARRDVVALGWRRPPGSGGGDGAGAAGGDSTPTAAAAAATTSEPAFLLVRMRPNVLPVPVPPTPPPPQSGEEAAAAAAADDGGKVQRQLAALRARLDAGAQQLQAACATVGPPASSAGVAYYELDVQLHQERVVFPSLHWRTVERVPVLLIPWGPDAVGVAQRLWEAKGAGRSDRGRSLSSSGGGSQSLA